MKTRYLITLIAGVAALAVISVILIFPAGKRPWVSRAPANSAEFVRIATFNVEGLFDPNDDPALSGDDDDVPSSDNHIEAISGAIHSTDADIIALQDIESFGALEWFNKTHLAPLGYEHIASLDVGHDSGAENAILSRFPIIEQWVWPDFTLGDTHPTTLGERPNPMAGKPMRFRRSPLMVSIDLPDKAPLILINIDHKGGNRFGYWREAEAAGIVELTRQIGLSNRIIVLGSFHCDPDDPALEPYFELGFRDPLETEGNSEFYATEITGDRTDFILANRVIGGDLDSETAFVLGGEIADRIRSGEADTTHLPVAIGLRIHSE